MKRVYLVRHGQTTYNEKGLVQDGTSQLTDLGKKQACDVAERLQGLDFDHLLVSDYERTKQTAEPIVAVKNIEPEYSELFREVRRPSEFFHLPRASEGFQNFLVEADLHFGDADWHYSDEENFYDVLQRVQVALQKITESEGDVAVVTHGHFIRVVTAYVATGAQLDGNLWRYMSKTLFASNTGITTLLYENDQWRLLTFNDHAHFAE